jgi:hypothetical protein
MVKVTMVGKLQMTFSTDIIYDCIQRAAAAAAEAGKEAESSFSLPFHARLICLFFRMCGDRVGACELN